MKVPQYRYRCPLGNLQPTTPDLDAVKREGWRTEHILVVSEHDERLDWVEKQFVRRLGERKALAAAIMTLLLTVLILIPTFFLGGQVTKAAAILVETIKDRFQGGIGEPPAWLLTLPLVGEHIKAYWDHLLNDAGSGAELLQRIYDPAKRLITSIASGVVNGVLQILLAILHR